jgi:hypothetical protein
MPINYIFPMGENLWGNLKVMKCIAIKVFKKSYFDRLMNFNLGLFHLSFYKNIDVCLVNKTFHFHEFWSYCESSFIKLHGAWRSTFFYDLTLLCN